MCRIDKSELFTLATSTGLIYLITINQHKHKRNELITSLTPHPIFTFYRYGITLTLRQ